MALRTPFRLAVVFATAASVVTGGFAAVPSRAAVPPTVVRQVSVPATTLVPRSGRRLVRLTPDGGLRAMDAARTGRTRVCSPIWFTAVGMTWDQQTGRPIEVRLATSRDGRSFGRTRALDAESGPDPGSAEYTRGASASSLLWTGGRRCVRLALDLPAGASLSDMRLHFINASGTSAGPGSAPRTQPADLGGGSLLSPPPASALTQTPRLISRKQWGARRGLMNCTPDVAPAVKMGFVHHTAGTNHYSRAKSDDIIRSIYAYHTRGRGWCDIAYNFLIDRFGRAYEGRSGGVTTPVVSAATQGFNTGSFSVALMGTYSHHRPRHGTLRTLRRVVAWRLDVAHVYPHGRARMVSGGGDNTRYRKGKRVRLPVISVHRTTGYTECPGRKMVRRLSGLRDSVTAAGLPKLYAPDVSPDGVTLGGTRRPVIEARGSGKLVWSVSVVDEQGGEVASFHEQTDDKLNLTWTDTGAHPFAGTPGAYDIEIRAETRGGEPARAAAIPFRVRAP